MKNKDDLILVYFDGACSPVNPGGRCGCGAVIYYNSKKIKEISEEYIPATSQETSNNIAEYFALFKALAFLVKSNLQGKKIIVRGDSKLVIKQMQGLWRIKEGLYVETAVKTKFLGDKFTNIKYKWIPREHNYKADELSKKALN